jgi:hypothetical protein
VEGEEGCVVSVFGKMDLQENLTKGAMQREACSRPDLTGCGKCELVADLRQLARVWGGQCGADHHLSTINSVSWHGP